MFFTSVTKNLLAWPTDLLPQSGQVNSYVPLTRNLFSSSLNFCYMFRLISRELLDLKEILYLYKTEQCFQEYIFLT